MRKKVIRFLLLCLSACPYLTGYCQSAVRGIVLDADNKPVAEATITEKGTNNGTSTDASGNFVLTVRPNAVLVVSIVGYQTREVPVANATNLTISLTSSTAELEGVVVTALGMSKQKRQ